MVIELVVSRVCVWCVRSRECLCVVLLSFQGVFCFSQCLSEPASVLFKR